MSYTGAVRIDIGPFLVRRQTVQPAARTVDGVRVNGMECHADTLDMGRLPVEVFDDGAILDVMGFSNRGHPISRVLSLGNSGKEWGGDATRLSWTILDEDPKYGIGGEPIRSIVSRDGKTVRKALAIHGKIVRAGRHENAGTSYFIMDVRAGSLQTSLACRMSHVTRAMRDAAEGGNPWIRASGFGNLVSLRLDGKLVWKIYVNNLQTFSTASANIFRVTQIQPEKVNDKIRECSIIPFE